MLPVLMMTLHLLSQGVLAQWNRRPYFCAEAEDCYSFMTICRDSEYETRAYEPSTWIGTRIFPREGRYRAVARLSEYFNKKNLPGIQIERTAPILTIFVNINGVPTETTVYSMLPRRLFNNPPIPRDVTVFIKQFPPMTVFVKSFGGWFTNIRQKSQDLFEDLLRQRESFLQNRFYTAQYNGYGSSNRGGLIEKFFEEQPPDTQWGPLTSLRKLVTIAGHEAVRHPKDADSL